MLLIPNHTQDIQLQEIKSFGFTEIGSVEEDFLQGIILTARPGSEVLLRSWFRGISIFPFVVFAYQFITILHLSNQATIIQLWFGLVWFLVM